MMTGITTVQGVGQLAALIAKSQLIPSAVTITKILTEVRRQNATLDQEALLAFKELLSKTGEMMGDPSGLLETALQKSQSRQNASVVELLRSVDALESVDGSAKRRLMERRIREDGLTHREKIRSQTHLLGLKTIIECVPIVIFSISAGYKYARPKTFWECVLGR
jgi:hypothetical protein